ncbi:DUF3413 domain-containing protein [Psychrobium sp. 1_MG-2023]|uniref:DUF3413 domain-containing protein n=1 Tax=Psychrobium sp. 1_MG-2023 TaxID=3062624 RepID=UPI0027341871|nr:DUF3413 domain-containing protein [Psychrobium sp. 1_MG-2023]MDP2561717.1 DUF3413 domain-containing protein [Psychrobium sp. 1_MG-2023]
MVDNSNSYKDRVSRLISWGHWFMLANIVIAMLMAIRYIFSVDAQPSLLSTLYVISTWIGHFGLLGIITYIIILFPLTFLLPDSRILRGLGAFLATVIIVALLIDGSIFQNYQLHLNLLVFDLNGFNLNNTIGWSSIALFLLALLMVELTIANLIWKRLAIIRNWDVGNRITLTFAGAFLLSHLLHIWADATVYRPILAYDRMFPFSHQSTARSFIKKYGLIDAEHETQLQLSNNPKTINYPLNALQCQKPKAENTLFITIASANSGLVNEQVMPNLFKLSAQGINAQQHITSSLVAHEAQFSLRTGIPAKYKSSFDSRKLMSPVDSLLYQETAKRVFSGDYDFNEVAAASVDQQNVDSAIEWIKEHSTTGFHGDITLFASQELSVPNDFTVPIMPLSQPMSAAERILAKEYIASLFYTDSLIGNLIDHVDLSNTTVVITAERGNDLNSIYQRSALFSKVNLHVPLVMLIPGVSPQEIHKQSSHYDVLPTVLRHHFNCGNPASDISVGYDLVSTQVNELFYVGNSQHFALYNQGNITEIDRQGQYKFYDQFYQRQADGDLSFQALIDVMKNINRFN